MNELIVTIVNRGFSDNVMDAARSAGAHGGTIVHAHGAGAHEAEKLFGVEIRPEKEMIFILVDSAVRNAVMKAISEAAGLGKEGRGISFALPVDDVLGVAMGMAPADGPAAPDGSPDPGKDGSDS